MKSKFSKIIIVIIVSTLFFALVGCKNETVTDRLKNNYGVDTQLLADYQIVCDIKGKTFTGVAPKYAVIQLGEEPTAFIQSYSKKEFDEGFSSDKNFDLKAKIEGHKNCCLEIPEEYYPNWDEEYFWHRKDGLDSLYTIYFPNEYKLIFYESGH